MYEGLSPLLVHPHAAHVALHILFYMNNFIRTIFLHTYTRTHHNEYSSRHLVDLHMVTTYPETLHCLARLTSYIRVIILPLKQWKKK